MNSISLQLRNGIHIFDSNLSEEHQLRQKPAEPVYTPQWKATPPLTVCLVEKPGASAGQNAVEMS